MRLFLLIILIVFSFKSSYSCCKGEDRTLTERLFTGKPGTIFTCKVLSTTPRPEGYTSSTNNCPGITKAQVIKVYFGHIDSSIITINEAGINIGEILLIYAENNSTIFNYGGICNRWSKEVTNTPDINYELQLLQQFSDIFKNKSTGHFSFINQNRFLIAEGRFRKGKAIKVWKHFYPNNGIIKSEFDLDHNITTQYSIEGIIKEKITINKNIGIYESYSTKINGQLSSKNILTTYDSSYFIQLTEYFENGNLKITFSEIQIKDEYYTAANRGGMTGLYEEHYENGRLKQIGQYEKNQPIGIWKYYKENGEYEKEIDYQNGTDKQSSN